MIKILAKILFYIGSLIALFAGISEIIAVRKRQQNKQQQNVWTPTLLMLVKFMVIPYYWIKATEMGLIPWKDENIISKFIAGFIWLIAVGYVTNVI